MLAMNAACGAVVCFLACAAAVNEPLRGQALVSGARIRLRLNAPSAIAQVGMLQAVRSDSIAWQPEGASEGVTMPLSAVTTLEVSGGQRSNAGKGALIGGATLGTLSLLVFGTMASPSAGVLRLEGGWRDALLLTAAGTATGAGVGALVGMTTRTEKWIAVPLTRLLAVPMSVSRVGFRVSLRL
jgi:hypothetical protein